MHFFVALVVTLQMIFLIYFYINKRKIKNRVVHVLAYTSTTLTTLSLFVFLFLVIAIFFIDDTPYSSWTFQGEVVHEIPNSNEQVIIREYSYLHHAVHSSVYYVDYDGNKYEMGKTIGERLNFTTGDYQINFLDDGVVVLYYSYDADEDFTEDYFEYPLKIE